MDHLPPKLLCRKTRLWRGEKAIIFRRPNLHKGPKESRSRHRHEIDNDTALLAADLVDVVYFNGSGCI
jgi:hypothetical protein